MTPKKPVTTIGFGPHFHTPATTTIYPASPFDQRLQRIFQPADTDHQFVADNTTADNPLLAQNGCELSKIIPLLRNLNLKDDTLIY